MMGSPNKGKGANLKWLIEHLGHEGEECLIWPFRSRIRGYGNLSVEGKMWLAHRYVCTLVHGPEPTPTHEAAHSCGRGNEGCVNPRHISWKTPSENQRDRRLHGTQGRGDNRRYKLDPLAAAEIRALRATETVTDLAAKFGVSRAAIRQVLSGKIWPEGSRMVRRFSPAEIEAIKAKRATKSYRELAAEYGIDERALWRLVNGRARHVLSLHQ